MFPFKKRTKEDVKSKKTLFGGIKADGKKRKLGVTVTFNDGETVTLLNPSGKATKYVNELKEGKRYTNDGKIKLDNNGNEMPLTSDQKAYRSAYIQSLVDSAKAYNAAQAKVNGGKQ